MKRALGRHLPPLDSLTLFECAAHHKSFTKAALQLNLTQSAVSRRILDLERFLGGSLFNRESKALTLTPRAARYLAEIEPLLLQLERATRDASELTDRRALRLRVTASYCNLWLIPRLPRLMARHPNLLLDIAAHTGDVDVFRDDFDAAIVAVESVSPRAVSYRLSAVHLVASAAPVLLKAHGLTRSIKRNTLTAEQILNLPRLHLQQSPNDWLEFARLAGAALPETDRSDGATHSLLQMNFHAAIAGMGVALLPSLFIDAALANGTLQRLSPIELVQQRSITLVHRDSATIATRIAPFLNWLQDEHSR